MSQEERLVDVSFSEGGADPESLIGNTEWGTMPDDTTNREPAVVFVFESLEDKVALLQRDPDFDVAPNGNEATWRPDLPMLFGGVERDPTHAQWYKDALEKSSAVPPELERWRRLGLPAFEPIGTRIFLRVPCESIEQRDALVERYGLLTAKKTREVISAWYPPRAREDLSSLRFDAEVRERPKMKRIREEVGVQPSLLPEELSRRLFRIRKSEGADDGGGMRITDRGVERHCWFGDHWLPETSEFWYRRTKGSKGPLWTSSRCRSCERLYRNPPGPTSALPRYPVYVISKGRWQEDRALTVKALLRDRVPFRVVVEPQEVNDYARIVPREQILELPFSNLGRGSIPARNWLWEHAISEGHARSWCLDDNIIEFRRLWKGRRIPCHAGVALRIAEDFADAHENVAIVALNYQMFVTAECPIPYYSNVHAYSCVCIDHDVVDREGRPIRWRGRLNEDTDLCLQVLDAGRCTVLVNAVMANKLKTLAMGGGNTDELYAGDGRLAMSRSLEEAWPGIVKTRWKFGRPQHSVRWDKFKQSLVLREDVAAAGDYGLKLRAVAEVRSDTLRKILEEY